MAELDETNFGEEDEVVATDAVKKKLADELSTPKRPSVAVKTQEDNVANMPKEHMKVFLRVRPFSEDEINRGENQGCVEVETDSSLVVHAPKDSNTYKNTSKHGQQGRQHQKFTFSKIFQQSANQKHVFDETVYGTVKQFVEGQNCLVFAYGVTNSGKTYTIRGSQNDPGILPRALEVVFNSVHGRQWRDMSLKPHMFCEVKRLAPDAEEEEHRLKEAVMKMAEIEDMDVTAAHHDHSDISRLTIDSTMSDDSLMCRQSLASNMSTNSHRDSGSCGGDVDIVLKPLDLDDTTAVNVENQGQIRYSIWVSYSEVYNENIYDLLGNPPKRGAKRTALQLKDDKNGNPYVKGLRDVQVTSADEAARLLAIGKKNLQVASTRLNHNSSRSHCIFTIKMLRVVDKDDPHFSRMSMLSFCDLAGSERYTKTQSFGERIKEAGNINTSLLTLGRCIESLRNNQMNKDHQQIVPFRESKLTRLFQSFFCGKGRASMIVNINQCASTFDETLHALKYSAIAKQVIVIQEPEKPPPKKPPKKYLPSKVSMLLAQTPNKSSRQTIGWATPGTYAKIIAEEEKVAEVPLPDDDDEELFESDREKELLDLIEQLKEELLQEKRHQVMLEGRIREEVCQEMALQLVEIESNYNQHLKKEQALMEERHERKIELLSQSVLKSRKRKRIAEEEEEEQLLGLEQAKVKEREKTIEELREQVECLQSELDDIKNATRSFTEDRDQLQQENTSLKFKLTEMEQKKTEVEAVAESVSELQSIIEESKAAFTEAEARLQAKDDKIAQLLADNESLRDSVMSQSQMSEVGEIAGKLSETEAELSSQREAVTKLQQLIDLLQCDAADKDNQVSAAQKEVAAKEKVVQELQTTIRELEGKLSDEASSEELGNIKKELEDKDSELQELKKVVLSKEEQLKSLQTDLVDKEENRRLNETKKKKVPTATLR